MKRRIAHISESDQAKLTWYRAKCFTCVFTSKTETVIFTRALLEAGKHHREWPDHWTVVLESKVYHSFKPEENFLTEQVDVPPY